MPLVTQRCRSSTRCGRAEASVVFFLFFLRGRPVRFSDRLNVLIGTGTDFPTLEGKEHSGSRGVQERIRGS